MTHQSACTLLEFPTGRPLTMRHVTLLRLDGRLMATAGFVPGDPGAPWAWICETVALDTGCSEDEVHVLESEEYGDLITVDGCPVARVSL